MKIDNTFLLDPKVDAIVQTLGFTGIERSNGQSVSIGGVTIPTPTGNGSNSGYWNNLFASQVAQTLSQNSKFNNFVIDVKDNTVILLSPSSYGIEKLELNKGSNTSIGMATNAPSGFVDGVWNGENPWSDFVGKNYLAPSVIPINVYTFGFTGGEKSNGSSIKVAGVDISTPVATTSNSGLLNNELARLHAEALNNSDIYKGKAIDVDLNTSILITPRTFNDSRVSYLMLRPLVLPKTFKFHTQFLVFLHLTLSKEH